MNNRSYIVDAVICRSEVSVGGIAACPVSVLGYGMRRALCDILSIVSSCDSYALRAQVSEIEATVTVPRSDKNRVMRAVSALINREAIAPCPRSKG